MNGFIQNYDYKYRIVSLALDEDTRNDLESENVSHIFCTSNEVVLFPEKIPLEIDVETKQMLQKSHNYDVYDIWNDGSIHLLYDNESIDNTFFITGQCNSNCLMCPSAEITRKNQEIANIDELVELAQHIPEYVPHLTITGGEPFMAGKKLFDLIRFIGDKFIDTELLILSNGRVFALKEYVELLKEFAPAKTIVAIPIHGSSSEKHNRITQANNSFEQTIRGIKNLLKKKIRVEIRIVVTKLNVDDIDNIAKLIANELKAIEYVSVIAPEMTGNAFTNRDIIWISYKTAFEHIINAIEYLLNNEITVKLYNYPLCTVPKKYWALCEKSISPEKVRFKELCSDCKYKSMCGGVFAGTFSLEKDELEIPI